MSPGTATGIDVFCVSSPTIQPSGTYNLKSDRVDPCVTDNLVFKTSWIYSTKLLL